MITKRGSIKGKFVYFAMISMLGLLTVFENPVIYGGVFLLAVLMVQKFKRYPIQFIHLLLVGYLIFLVVGFVEKQNAVSHYEGNEAVLTIVFKDRINVDGDHLSAIGETFPTKERVAVRYYIKSEEEKQLIKNQVSPGTSCKAAGKLELPEGSRNPNAFDYKEYLYHNGVYWIFTIKTVELESCFSFSDDLMTRLERYRQLEMNAIAESFPVETAALFNALIFGDKSLFDPTTKDAYRKIGIIHLLAISGLHVALVSGFFRFGWIRLGLTKEKADLLLFLFLPLYTILTGLAPPVLRASGMLMLIIATRYSRFRLPSIDAVSIALMIMLFLNPFLLYDTGFRLSYSVSFALILSSKKILAAFDNYIHQIVAMSLVAQLSAMPIILFSFYEISTFSLFTNLLFIPLFSFIVLPAVLLLYFIFSLAGVFPVNVQMPIETAIHLMNKLSVLLAELPGAAIVVGRPGGVMLFFIIISVSFFFRRWEHQKVQKKKIRHAELFLPILPLLVQIAIPYVNPYGEIIFIDVGQGDSIFIKLPFNKGNYLIDSGGATGFWDEEWRERREKFDPGKDTVVPLLKSKGIRRLDKLILTHGDGDHIGGASAVIDEIKVGQLVLPKFSDRADLEQQVIEKAKKSKVSIYYGGEGTSWQVAGNTFRILNPSVKSGDRNEDSIVLFAEIGGRNWLFTGDLGTKGEKLIIEKYGHMEIDILKVGHHGSKTSTSEEFLENLHPERAVISVKKKNRYGHPSKEVLDRLKSKGIKIYRTDENGAIIYRFQGESGTFRTQIP